MPNGRGECSFLCPRGAQVREKVGRRLGEQWLLVPGGCSQSVALGPLLCPLQGGPGEPQVEEPGEQGEQDPGEDSGEGPQQLPVLQGLLGSGRGPSPC